MQARIESRPLAREWNSFARAEPIAQSSPVEAEHQITVLTDLSKWIAPARIKEWVEAEIRGLGEEVPNIGQFPWSRGDRPSDPLLALLSFAYITGVFYHEDVAAKCRSELVFRLLSEGTFPSAQELSNFRRRNRHLLERILAGVLLRAVEQSSNRDFSWMAVEVAEELGHRAADRLDLARHVNSGD